MAVHTRYITRRRMICAVTVLLLIALLLPVAVLPVMAADGRATASSPTLDRELTPSQVLAQVLTTGGGEILSDAEAEWLDHEASAELTAALKVSYDGTVSREYVTLIPEDGETALVEAQSFMGEISRGQLTWIPVTVTVAEESYALRAEADVYRCDVPWDGNAALTVTVTYEAYLTVDTEAVNRVLNAAYEAATEANAAYAAYETALEAYRNKEMAYEAYRAALTQYKNDTAAYQSYRKALKTYQAKAEAYAQYVKDMETYRDRLADYETYLGEKADYDRAYALYLEFVDDPAAYEEKYLAYCAWLADMAQVRAKLAVMDSCFVTDSRGHKLFATLKGPTVTTVVNRQEELVAAGCSKADIDNADRATATLSALLEAYPQKGTEAEKYAYYQKNYTAIKDNVRLLYTSLATLYNNDLVPEILEMQDRLERYWQFVGQLYVLSCLLDDGEVWQSTWTIAGTKLTDLVEDCYLLTDHNKATPVAPYPGDMEEVPAPETMTKQPVPPTPVLKPTVPETVEEPVRPTEVRKPTAPAVVQAPDPATKPVAPVFSRALETLRNAVAQGTLCRRDALQGELTYPLMAKVDRVLAAEDRPVVYVYHHDRMTLLTVLAADRDGCVTLPAGPDRPMDKGYTYTFTSWMLEDGTPVTSFDMTLTEDTVVYAAYEATPRRYTVTWVVDGEATDVPVPYGEVPSFAGLPTKEADAACTYEFTRWSHTPVAVTGDVTYEAVFRAIPRRYTVTWQWPEGSEQEELLYGEMPDGVDIPQRFVSGRYLYTFTGWSPVVTSVAGDAVYEAVYESTDLMPASLGGQMSAEITDSGWWITGSDWLQADGWLADISRLAPLAYDEDESLILSADGVSLTLGSAALKKLSDAGAVWLTIRGWADARRASSADTLTVTACDGDMIPMAELVFSVRMSLTPEEGYTLRLYDGDGDLIAAGEDGATVTFTATAGQNYTLDRGIPVIFHTVEGGLCRTERELYGVGQQVTFTVTPQPGYALQGVTATDARGDAVPLNVTNGGYTFAMPAGGVTVIPAFTPLTFTVSFYSNGALISQETYRYGQTPTIPADPARGDDETYRYTFIGWTPVVTPVLKDAVYEAEFLAVPLDYDASVTETALRIWQLALIAGAAYLTVTAAILVPYFVIRHRRTRGDARGVAP